MPPGRRARSPSRDHPCVRESRTDGRSKDRASEPSGPAKPRTGILFACRCARWPAIPEHRSEPGSSPIKNVKNSTQRIGIHRPVNPNAAPITEVDFNQPAGVAGSPRTSLTPSGHIAAHRPLRIRFADHDRDKSRFHPAAPKTALPGLPSPTEQELFAISCRRATSQTTVPGAKLSSTIRILSSCRQRRRRSAAKTSIFIDLMTLSIGLRSQTPTNPSITQGGLRRMDGHVDVAEAILNLDSDLIAKSTGLSSIRLSFGRAS